MSVKNPLARFSPAVTALIVIGALLLALIVAGISAFGMVNSAQKTGTQKEAALSAQYSVAQNELSTLIGSVKDSLGVANMKADKMDQILTDAITGRYDGKGTASVSDAQLVINAIHEAYPDMTPLNTYDQVITTITSGRQAFKDQQNKLLDMLRDFETFRKSGLINRQVVKIAGIPDDTLRAAIGKDVVFGTAALERMYSIVLAEGTVEAYETGVMPDLVPSTNE